MSTIHCHEALYGQLVTIAYNRSVGRLDVQHDWRFPLALRTALVAELYLSGHVVDDGCAPRVVSRSGITDPLLRAAIGDLTAQAPEDWMHAVARSQHTLVAKVLSELVARGSVRHERHWVLGAFPVTRIQLCDDAPAAAWAASVTAAIHDAVAGGAPDPRSLNLGLIAYLAEYWTVFNSAGMTCDGYDVAELVASAIPPIQGMSKVLHTLSAAIARINTGPYA